MLKKWLCAAAFAAVALLMTPGVSSAQRRGGGGWGGGGWSGYRGGWGGYRGYSGYGSYWRGFWPGLTVGYGSGYGGYGYSYPYSYGGTYYSEPSYVYAEPSSTPSYYYSPSDTAQNPNVALIEVKVPENAELWFEGDKTSQTGAVRHFRSPELQPGKMFTYDIRARWTDAGGKEVDRTKQVKVQAGARVGVDFNNP